MYIVVRPFKIWQTLWGCVWNLSELSGIGLGRFAPWVFGQAIGARSWKKTDHEL